MSDDESRSPRAGAFSATSLKGIPPRRCARHPGHTHPSAASSRNDFQYRLVHIIASGRG
jgi:hypothetical protein